MSSNAMGWWYWFGMQIFGIASLVLTWWLFLDASRRKGAPTRFVWPIVSLAGLLMQIPAFAVAEANQTSGTGTSAAVLGVFGLIVVSLAAITHFYKSPASGGTGWSMRTRDENSSSRSTSDRRKARVPQASVPVVPGTVVNRAGQAPLAPPPQSRTLGDPSAAAQAVQAPSVHGSTIHGEGPAASQSGATDGVPATLVEEPATTLTDEPAASSAAVIPGAPPAPTIAEDGGPVSASGTDGRTIIDDRSEALTYDTNSPRIMITDGKSSRIIITERSGPFIVGRDPERSALAVEDPRASRAHFSVTMRDGSYYLQDLGSSNGTFVNGALVGSERLLADGDTIEFGRTVATFRMPS